MMLFLLLAFVATSTYAQSGSNVRWEYNIQVFEATSGDLSRVALERINELGRQGWELVAATWNPSDRRHILYFKRGL